VPMERKAPVNTRPGAVGTNAVPMALIAVPRKALSPTLTKAPKPKSKLPKIGCPKNELAVGRPERLLQPSKAPAET